MDNRSGWDKENINSLLAAYSSSEYFNFVAAFLSTGNLTRIASLKIKLTRSFRDSRSNDDSRRVPPEVKRL